MERENPQGPSKPETLAEILLSEQFTIKLETPEHPRQLAARLRDEKSEGELRRRKDFILFCAAIAGVGMIAFVCSGISLRPGSSPDDKKWAMSILSAVVSGLVGFLTGKAVK